MADEGYQPYSSSNATDVAKTTAEDLPGVGPLVKGGFDAASGKIGSVGSDIASFASGAAGIVEDPLNALISAGLGFLMDVITPLKTELQKVTGNPDALDKGSEAFTEIGKDISKMANELTDITSKGIANWTGDAKNAAAKQINDFITQVDETAGIAGNVSMCLQLSGTLMDAAYNFVLGIISQCIEWLIVTWLAAQAAALFTFGASEAAAGAATAVEVSTESANAADKVEEATTLVEKIVNIIKQLWSKIQNMVKYVGKMKDADKAAEDAAKDGTKVAGDASKAASEADKAAGDAGKAASEGDKAAGDAGKADKNYLQNKVDETKENWNNKTNPTIDPNTGVAKGGQGFGDYMKDKAVDQAKDAGKDVLINGSGNVVNSMQYGAQTSAPAPLPDGQNQNQDDPSMSGNLYE
ncbi:MAG TPA: hypothetical protein VG247_04485 [Pseudonocardiaceae bacterium]|jgi:hypothetical protein|nr:hypothetical protein [Pseudonocardiaceae bacterium]